MRKGKATIADEQLKKLSASLFWDVDMAGMSMETYPMFLITRVLERGNLNDWRIIRDYYGIERIAEECKKVRSLDPVCLAFVCAISDTKKEDYRCYHFRQSHPTLWNS